MKRVLTIFPFLLLACGETPEPPESAGTPPARRLEGETLIVQKQPGPTPLGIRLEGVEGSGTTPSLLNLSVSSDRLPVEGFGALACFQATDHPRERTQVCMGFRHSQDVTEENSQPELFFFRIERVDGLDRPHVMFSAGKNGLTVYADNGAWWTGETWDREGNTVRTNHLLQPVARIGSDGVIRAKAFQVVKE